METSSGNHLHLGATFDPVKYQKLEEEALRNHPEMTLVHEGSMNRSNEPPQPMKKLFKKLRRNISSVKVAVKKLAQKSKSGVKCLSPHKKNYVPFAEFEAAFLANKANADLELQGPRIRNPDPPRASESIDSVSNTPEVLLKASNESRPEADEENDVVTTPAKQETKFPKAQIVGEVRAEKAAVSNVEKGVHASNITKSAEEILAEIIQRQRKRRFRIEKAERVAKQQHLLEASERTTFSIDRPFLSEADAETPDLGKPSTTTSEQHLGYSCTNAIHNHGEVDVDNGLTKPSTLADESAMETSFSDSCEAHGVNDAMKSFFSYAIGFFPWSAMTAVGMRLNNIFPLWIDIPSEVDESELSETSEESTVL